MPRSRLRGLPRYCLPVCLALALAFPALAQVQSVTVSKGYNYDQVSATSVRLGAEHNNFSFNADVDGNNIGGIATPRITGPINVAAVGTFHNNGNLFYSTGDRGWRYGSNGTDFGTSSISLLNTAFPNGTYTMTVNGAAIALQLTGDAYPNPPILTLTGGAWANGKYVLDPAQPLGIRTNAFLGYNSNVDGLICIAVEGTIVIPFQEVAPYGCAWTNARQSASTTPGSNTLATTIPANTFVAGREYFLFTIFHSIVDRKPNAAVPGSDNVAYYQIATKVMIKTETPVFPMTVTGGIGPVTSTVTANIQYRPQDLGTTQSVYTFAVAPATAVQASSTKEAPLQIGWARDTEGLKETAVACVLCQLNASGQLQAVSAAAMRAYVTGVLGAQGQSVAILSGVPSINIGGAAFYVGYGTSATTMLATGVNRRAIAAPGSLVCDPGAPQAGWWWNTAEGGRGYSIEAQGRNIFYAAFLYDESGRSKWYVATGPTSIDGALYTGDLLEARGGQTLTGAYRAPSISTVGPFTLIFNNLASGTMSWPGGNVPIERFNIVANGVNVTPVEGQPESGWWWNPAESGRGFFIEWQGNTFDLAGYMYDDQGNPVWYLAVYSTTDITRAAGSWWTYANGQTLTGAYRPATQTSNNFAPVAIRFTSATTAVLTLPDGRTTNLQRQRY